MDELELQTREALDGRPITQNIFPFQARPAGLLDLNLNLNPHRASHAYSASINRAPFHAGATCGAALGCIIHLFLCQTPIQTTPVCGQLLRLRRWVCFMPDLCGAPASADKAVARVPQYAFNLFSHNSPMTGNGYNEEEMKMVKETRKIWCEPDIAITATCIRVPIMRAHAESINLEFEDGLSEEQARPVGCLIAHLRCYVALEPPLRLACMVPWLYWQ